MMSKVAMSTSGAERLLTGKIEQGSRQEKSRVQLTRFRIPALREFLSSTSKTAHFADIPLNRSFNPK